jgi:S-adenosylmethionine hydrolase
MTGLRAGALPPATRLTAMGEILERRRTFAEATVSEAFWYENSLGLAEIAVNRGSAVRILGLEPGAPVAIAD